MKITSVTKMTRRNSTKGQIGLKDSRKKSAAPTREELFIWAECQRTLFAAGKLPAAHAKALMAIPSWSWELTQDKGLADACWFYVNQDS